MPMHFGSDCACCFDPLRRRVLAGLGAAAAGAFLPAGGSIAQAPRRRIDVHHHLMPPIYQKEARETLNTTARGTPGFNLLFKWTPQMSIDEMDRYGTQTAMVSISTPGVHFGSDDAARRLAREVNDFGAKMVRDFPGRFGLFAVLPLPDVAGSLREIEYAFDTLKADGVGILTNYGDKWLGDPAFAPVFDELNRRKAVVFVHPHVANCCGNLLPFPSAAGSIELLFDTTRTIYSLLYSFTTVRCPELRFIFCHGGGATAQMAERVTASARNPAIAGKFPKGILAEVQKLNVEMTNMTMPNSYSGVRELFGTGRMLLGSDYPFSPTLADTIGGLNKLNLPPAELQAIERDNALALLPRFKG